MLTKEQVIFTFKGSEVHPDRLVKSRHQHYLSLAQRMLDIYRNGVGLPRKELHRRIDYAFDEIDDCPPRRIAAFQKLLDEYATYESGKQWNTVRRKVYALAGDYYPIRIENTGGIFAHDHIEVKTAIAEKLDLPWERIEANLFSDVLHFQKLATFRDDLQPQDLLARYNVAQAQGLLYWATQLDLTVREDHKMVIRQIKLARLIHTIERNQEGYRIVLDGPASVLQETRRYGSAMARFLPSLLACRDWQFTAHLKLKSNHFRHKFRLSSNSGLKSPIAVAEAFDSNIEECFAKKWGKQRRDGWTLHRETRILSQGQKVFVPDFVLTHDSGCEVLFEIAGFWSEDYWKRKLDTLQVFADVTIILAVPKRYSHKLTNANFPVIQYGTAIKLNQLLRILKSRHAS